MAFIEVTVDQQGIALLELNRPDVLNVMSEALLRELKDALEELAAREDVRALVVTGRGRGFCAGADLGTIDSSTVPSIGQWVSELMREHFNPAMDMLHAFPRPVISAVNGIAAGGGAALALCADIVLAADSAALKVVQVSQLGIVADLGANWFLPRMAGRSRALGACLLGETLPASQLLEWGLVWACVEQDKLLEEAKSIAAKLADLPSETIVATRKLIDAATQDSFSSTLEKERLCQETLCDQVFFTDAVASFMSR